MCARHCRHALAYTRRLTLPRQRDGTAHRHAHRRTAHPHNPTHQGDDDKKKLKKKRLLSGSGSGGASSSSGADDPLRKKRKSSTSGGTSSKAAPSSSSSAAAAGKKKKSSGSDGSGSSSKRSAGVGSGGAAVGPEGDEDTWVGCYNGDRRLAAVTHGVEWALQQLSPESQARARSDDDSEEEEDDAATILPSLYSLVRLTLDPVRQDVLESLAPQLEAWKERCLVRAAAAGATQGKGKGARWGQAALIGAFRRVVQLERLGVYAPKEAKRALVEGYVSGTCVRVCIYWVDWTCGRVLNPHNLNPPKPSKNSPKARQRQRQQQQQPQGHLLLRARVGRAGPLGVEPADGPRARGLARPAGPAGPPPVPSGAPGAVAGVGGAGGAVGLGAGGGGG